MDKPLPAELTVYAEGILSASVCTSLTNEEAVQRMPSTGARSHWQISSDTHFRTGEENGFPCPDHPETHRHLLFEC